MAAADQTVPIPLFGPPGLKGKLPNLLTALRLVLAAAFFATLGWFDASSLPDHAAVLLWAAIVFSAAAFTDFLDGFLARKWNAVSVFGRVMDPFADKILVLGAFVMLAGPNFQLPSGVVLSGVAPWMVVVIIARELLITSLRGLCESRGVNFSASLSGKLKMIAQSVGVPAILLLGWLAARAQPISADDWRIGAAYWIALGTTIITAVSAVPYVTKGFAALSRQDSTP